MLKIIKSNESERLLSASIERNREIPQEIITSVTSIINDVKSRGDAAIIEYTERFDGVKLNNFIVPIEEAALACKRLKLKKPQLYDALKLAAGRITKYHKHQQKKGFSYTTEDGSILGQRVMPLERVGIYVPGGTAAYPSSVMMNVIPAKIAGVKEIIMVVPPNMIHGADSTVKDSILAAAHISGATAIYSLGGAQAIAALAYGTETIPKVDKICGPGNIYVATAKQMVFGAVDIDMIAGPSEILIIADEKAKPAYIAADMLSQAEHDPMASSVLLCPSESFANKVSKELSKQLANLSRNEIAEQSIKNYGFAFIYHTLSQAVEISNRFAPEHLEILTENPMDLLDSIKNAGSIFLGEYSPEPIGDYIAGPNHVLPTSGSARFFSPLSVDSYLKRSSYIKLSKEEFMTLRGSAGMIADIEGLTAHHASLKIRK